ncbi:MAG: hypothetical protein AAF533_02700 [Acidobacteriota bacterium]
MSARGEERKTSTRLMQGLLYWVLAELVVLVAHVLTGDARLVLLTPAAALPGLLWCIGAFIEEDTGHRVPEELGQAWAASGTGQRRQWGVVSVLLVLLSAWCLVTFFAG